MDTLRKLVDLFLRLFALGLVASIVLNWISPLRLRWIQGKLNSFYDIFLNPIRRYVKPVRLGGSAPVGLDLAPLILLLLIWWIFHPLLMWVFGAEGR